MGTVLVVDDNELVRRLAGAFLERAGHVIFPAEQSIEVADILNKKNIEVVFLEPVLHSDSGVNMFRRIKDTRPDTPVIVMTASASMESAIKSFRLGGCDYIKKPLNPHELLHSVENALVKRSLLVERRIRMQKMEERAKKLELFEKASMVFSSTLDLRDLLERIMSITKDTIGAEACSVLLVDKASGELSFAVAIGKKADELGGFRIKPGQGIGGWVLENGESILVEDAGKDERFFAGVDRKTGFKTRSIIAVPLFKNGMIIGVIEVINKIGDTQFCVEDKDVLVTLSGQVSVVIDNAMLAEDLKRSHEKIGEYSRDLELMVHQRTEELERAIRELRATQADRTVEGRGP